MRDSAVLTRPLGKESAWQEAPSRQPTMRQQALILGGVFILALLVGFGITRLIPGTPTQRVSNDEYTAVVAQLYLKDHDLSLARERLTVIGTPSDLLRGASDAAQSGRLASPNDRAALDALSAALASPSTVDPAQTATTGTATAGNAASSQTVPTVQAAGAAQPVPTIDAAATSQAGGTGASTDSSGADTEARPSWIGPLVAFFLALTLGFLVLARTAGIKLPSLTSGSGEPRVARRPSAPSPRRSTLVGNRSLEGGPASSISMADVNLEDDADGEDEADPTFRPLVKRSAGRVTRGAVAVARRPKVFQTQYRLGDDPFEEIHPIADPRTGGLIAACGLTATLRLDSVRSGGYYAFTAWVQDYAGGDELHAAGLVAPGSTEVARGAIDSWVRSGQVDTVLAIEPGTVTEVGTDEIKALISVVDASYGKDDRVEDAYITSLTVRFEIRQGEPDETGEG